MTCEVASRSVKYFTYNGKEHQVRVFAWSIKFNPKEETSQAAIWISLPNLSPDLFACKSLHSIVAVVGKPIVVDKATQTRSRPSAASVRLILDLLDEHPDRIHLKSVDNNIGKILEELQEVIYDNLPLYCNHYKHQGHDENMCRLLLGKKAFNSNVDESVVEFNETLIEKLQGDAWNFLNAKRAG